MPLHPSPEPVWVIGPVTWDVTDEGRRPGGAALYVARTCEALQVTAQVLHTGLHTGEVEAGAHVLSVHRSHRVGASTLTLHHDFSNGRREQSLLDAAMHTLVPGDVPEDWPRPVTLILGPLLPEDVDVLAFVDEFADAQVAVIAQGLQRAVLPDGRIAHRVQPSSALIDAARPNVSIFLSDDEVRMWPVGAIEYLAVRAARVVVTHGAKGATVYDRMGSRFLPSVEATAVDSTGAGDVFAAAFILAIPAGEAFAGRLAAASAAAAVEIHGPGALPSLEEILHRAALPADRIADGGSAA
ncbi:MAG: carbohydrate kinase family protein [Dehalococcoidia bacterium]